MIVALKALHIIALALWAAMLLGLPMLLLMHRQLGPGRTRAADYARFRLLTHASYTMIATPAAVVAIVAGTMLIFATGIFEPWLLAKLAAVAALVLAHAWLGHLTLQAGEKPVSWRMPSPLLALLVILPALGAILWLVLLKPDLHFLAGYLPAWALQPAGYDLNLFLPEALP